MDKNPNTNTKLAENKLKIWQDNNSFDEEKYNAEISETLLDEDKKIILSKLKGLWINIDAENIPILLSVFTEEMVDFLKFTCDREKYTNIINLFIIMFSLLLFLRMLQ